MKKKWIGVGLAEGRKRVDEEDDEEARDRGDDRQQDRVVDHLPVGFHRRVAGRQMRSDDEDDDRPQDDRCCRRDCPA